ncbi:MAG TPA: TPM domain-containing protein [Acidimicrobiales bacterium]|nr:TPM domain-containing protein [Acidimicrobiales bacterium]
MPSLPGLHLLPPQWQRVTRRQAVQSSTRPGCSRTPPGRRSPTGWRRTTRTGRPVGRGHRGNDGRCQHRGLCLGLFNAWGVGHRDDNDGALLVVAAEDRKLRIQTGRGLGERLSDQRAKQIIDDHIVPRFKRTNTTPAWSPVWKRSVASSASARD